jgi:PmbA protein
MFNENEAKTISDKILKRCKQGEQAELIMTAIDSSLTRFANNSIHQNVNEHGYNVMFFLHDGKRKGSAMTTSLEDAALDAMVAKARQYAQTIAEDPDAVGPADPTPIQKLSAYDEATASYPPEKRAEGVGKVCEDAEKRKLKAFGTFVTGQGAFIIANTNGVFGHHLVSWADFAATVQKGEASARAEGSHWKIDELDIEGMGKEAIHKAAFEGELRKIEPGEYTVILDPYATSDIVQMLSFHGMSGLDVLEGRSWMNEIIGKQAMHPSVNIWDDGLDMAGLPQPFDFEGTPKHRVDIVRGGVIGEPVYSRKIAKLAGKSTTGHAIPPITGEDTAMPMNLFMAGGSSSVEEMIRSTKRGLYITRFWYTRLMHPHDCVITGMTRDGVFMIEDGKLAYPVKNLRFTQSYVKALADVEAISAETRLLRNDFGGFYMSIRTPALKIAKFNFTGTTV